MNCLSLLISLSLLAGGNSENTGAEACIAAEESDSLQVSSSELADRIIIEAKKYLGKPYRSGGKGPYYFDCSGFTRYIYGRFGFKLSPSSYTQASEGKPVEGSISTLQKGDILLFGTRRNSRRVGHVGIYIGPDKSGEGFTFIHAATHGGIKISQSDEEYYKERFLGARRILPDFFNSPDGTSFFPEGSAVEIRDTIILGEKDFRIVLFDNGTWGYLTPEGILAKTDDDKQILLDTNGRWAAIPLSKHTIPSLKDPPQEETPAPETETVATNGKSSSSTQKSSVSTQKSSSSTQKTSAQTSSANKQYHTVKSGDTLYGIASKYHTSVKALCSLNGISSTTVLQIGKKLRVK